LYKHELLLASRVKKITTPCPLCEQLTNQIRVQCCSFADNKRPETEGICYELNMKCMYRI